METGFVLSSRLKINFFTPLPPAKTEIASHSARILPALAGLCDVVVWTPQSDAVIPEVDGVTVRSCDGDVDPAALNSADLTFYNIGSNKEFHDAIYRTSCMSPGIVILHDTNLQYLFSGMAQDSRKARFAHYLRMGRHCGPQAAREAEQALAGRLSIDALADRFPLTEAVAHHALGVVIHDESQKSQLEERLGVPTFNIPLAFDARSSGSTLRRVAAEPFRLIIIDHSAADGCVLEFLKALPGLDDCRRFRLDIFGALENAEIVQAAVKAKDLDQIVTLHGEVPEKEIEAALSRAHLAINLRYPILGKASSSQLRIWSHGLPSLVMRMGWHASLPNDTVFLVEPDRKIESIQAHLKAFLRDPLSFWQAGARGYEVLIARHTSACYARALVDVAHRRRELHARHAANRLARRTADVFWESADTRGISAIAGRISTSIHDLTRPEPDIDWR